MNYTTNINLQKPLTGEKYNIAVHNTNSDILDSEIQKLKNKDDAQDKTLATKTELSTEISNLSSTLTSSIETETSRAKSVETSLSTAITDHAQNKENPHEVTKEQVGLGNADNTSDVDKPVSTAQNTAIANSLTEAKAYTDTTFATVVEITESEAEEIWNAVFA